MKADFGADTWFKAGSIITLIFTFLMSYFIIVLMVLICFAACIGPSCLVCVGNVFGFLMPGKVGNTVRSKAAPQHEERDRLYKEADHGVEVQAVKPPTHSQPLGYPTYDAQGYVVSSPHYAHNTVYSSPQHQTETRYVSGGHTSYVSGDRHAGETIVYSPEHVGYTNNQKYYQN